MLFAIVKRNSGPTRNNPTFIPTSDRPKQIPFLTSMHGWMTTTSSGHLANNGDLANPDTDLKIIQHAEL